MKSQLRVIAHTLVNFFNTQKLAVQKIKIKKSFKTFQRMSKLGQINAIIFTADNCYIELKNGCRYYFDPQGSGPERLFSIPTLGTFEKEEVEVIRKLIAEGDTCFDVGACFGFYTVLLSNLVADIGRVYSFEPLPHSFYALERNILSNNLKNVIASNLAVNESLKLRKEKLFLPDIGVSGSLKLHKFKKRYQIFEVDGVSIDTYVSDLAIEKLDFIKADIEGAEFSLLRGAITTIKKYRPTIMLEIQQSSTVLFGYEPSEVFNFLSAEGYRAFYIERGKLQNLETFTDLPKYNFFFLHEEKIGNYLGLING